MKNRTTPNAQIAEPTPLEIKEWINNNYEGLCAEESNLKCFGCAFKEFILWEAGKYCNVIITCAL